MANNNAYLVFNTVSGKISTYNVVCTMFTRQLNMQITDATLSAGKEHYPIRLKEQDFSFSIQCRNEKEYDTLKLAIRNSHVAARSTLSNGYVRFYYPAVGIDYLGLINSSPEGIRRFDYTPPLNLTMTLIKDTVNTGTNQYSTADGTWQDIYGTSVVDLYNTNVNNSDYIAAENPPTSNVPTLPGGPGGHGPAVQ